MKIENQEIIINQQKIEESNKEATIQEEDYGSEENQEPTEIKIKLLTRLKENYIKNNIKIKNKQIQDKSCSTNEASNKYTFKFINCFKKKGKIFLVKQQECVEHKIK